MALTGTDLAVECYDNPSAKKCAEAFAMVIPGAGEIKGLKTLEEIDKIAEAASKTARITDEVVDAAWTSWNTEATSVMSSSQSTDSMFSLLVPGARRTPSGQSSAA
ncbi:hypothetical protein ACWGNF_09920 [Streptomyces sp. NPDC055808]